MPLIRSAALVLLATLAGCCYHAAETPPGLARGSVEQTTDYMKWAFGKRSAAHVYNCLSEGLKERENLSLADVDLFFEEIEGRVKDLLGDIDAIEIADVDRRGPRTAWVTYRSGARRAVVRFVLETTYEIVPCSDDDDGDFDSVPSMTAITSREDGRLVLRLPDEIPDVGPEGLHRVTILNAWLIDALDRSTVDALEP